MPTILNKSVGPVGYGLMSLTNSLTQNAVPREKAFAALKNALNNGANLWNGGEFYGPPNNNSLTLLREYYEKYPEDVDKVVVCIKGATDPYPNFRVKGKRSEIRESVETCLKELGPKGRIDLFEPSRRDTTVPYEETLNALQELVDEGKIGGISLSEVNADSIREAAKHVKIETVEIELSLFVRDPIFNGITAACKELNIPITAYSPVGRGLLTGTLTTAPTDPMKAMWPKFSAENFDHNKAFADKIVALAQRKGCTPAQLSIAWVIELGKREDMPTIIPIPGTGNPDRVLENTAAKDVKLTEADLKEIDGYLEGWEPKGDRYPEVFMKYVNL